MAATPHAIAAKKIVAMAVNSQGVIDDSRVLELVRALLQSKMVDKVAIAREVGRQAELLRRQYQAIITTPVEIDAATRKSMLQSLSTKFPQIKEAEWRVEPNILGGFTLLIGDSWYDASIANDLETIREQLSQ